MTPIRIAFSLCLGLAAAACAAYPTEHETAAAADTGARQCFFAQTVDGFQAVDDSTVNLRIGVSDVYQVKLLAPCHDIGFAQGIALRSTSGTSNICSPLDAELVVPGPAGAMRCPLSSYRKLTVAEVKALPPKLRP